MRDKKQIIFLFILAVVLVALYIGLGLNARTWRYALSRRIPKLVAVVATGSAIAYSTTVFQTITHNRILTPSVMGLDSLYLLIQTLVVFLLGGTSSIMTNPNLRFVVTTGSMMLFAYVLYSALFRRETGNMHFLLLVGLIMGTLFQSMTSFIQMVIDPNEFVILQGRMYASFNNVDTSILTVGLVVMGAVFIYAARYLTQLDVIALGREQAVNLGISYDWIVRRMLLVVAILISVATALVGPITFLGLLVANLGRQFMQSFQHKYVILASILISIVALVGGQLLLERILNFATPISVLINLMGGLYFIYLLLKESAA